MIDLIYLKVVPTVEVSRAPQVVLVDPAGLRAYVSCYASGQIAVIDLKDWKLEKLIATGPMTDGMAWAM